MKLEILQDTLFTKELGFKGLSTALTAHQVFDYLSWSKSKKPYSWTIAEWHSKHLMRDEKNFVENENEVKYFNESKSIIIKPGKGYIEFNADTRKEYIDKPRGGSDPWVHLLLEQSIPMDKRIMLGELDNLYAELDIELSKSDKYMSDEEYDVNVHASQFSWYFTVENCKCKELDFEGRPDYLWFGLPIYDNRFQTMNKVSIFLDYGTQKLIYAKNRNDYLPETVELGKRYHICVDILPEIKIAFKKAKEQGWLKGADFSDMAIGSTNIGWEIPGTFDVTSKIYKLSLIGEKK